MMVWIRSGVEAYLLSLACNNAVELPERKEEERVAS